jgi:alpha,alpha-trehalase
MLHINPLSPEELGRLHMHIRYRGHALGVEITPTTLIIKAYPTTAGPIRICFKDQIHEIPAGGVKSLTLKL